MKINDELLKNVTGGVNNDTIVKIVTELLAEYGVEIEPELIIKLIDKGGLTLRDFVKSKLPQDAKGMANIIPSFGN